MTGYFGSSEFCHLEDKDEKDFVFSTYSFVCPNTDGACIGCCCEQTGHWIFVPPRYIRLFVFGLQKHTFVSRVSRVSWSVIRCNGKEKQISQEKGGAKNDVVKASN